MIPVILYNLKTYAQFSVISQSSSDFLIFWLEMEG